MALEPIMANAPHFYERELKSRLQDVFTLIDEGKGPVFIHMDNGKDFVIFSWEDYFERFGCLYSQEEIEAIYEACRRYKEEQ